jgi:hypothetical protein
VVRAQVSLLSGESPIQVINKLSVVNANHQSVTFCIWAHLSLAGGVFVAQALKAQILKANGQRYKAKQLKPGICKNLCLCLSG